MSGKYIAALAAVVLGAGQLALIVSKLTGHIHMSWTLVMAPLWAPVVIAIVLVVAAVALFAGSSNENLFR